MSEWISVKNELPKDDKPVLVYVNSAKDIFKTFYDHKYEGCYSHPDFSSMYLLSNVSHWQRTGIFLGLQMKLLLVKLHQMASK